MATQNAKFNVEFTVSGDGSVKAKIGDLNAAVERSERTADKAAKSWAAFGTGLGTILGTVGGGALARYVKNTIEAEKVQAQLEAHIKSTGAAAGLSVADLNRMADALQQATTFDDESINGVQSVLLTFTRIGKDVFPTATEAVLNLSTALGTDLDSAAIQVGKALNDPIKGITALSRAGVQFTADQRETIKTLVETGRVAEAQRLILKELETQMGGSARAARETLGGALEALGNTIDNLLEGETSEGGLRGTADAVNELSASLNDPQIKAGIDTIASSVAWLSGQLVEGTSVIANYISRLTTLTRFNAGSLNTGNADYDQLTQRYGQLAQSNADLRGGALGALKQLYGADGTLNASDLLTTRDQVIARQQKEMQSILRRQAEMNRQEEIAGSIVWNPNANQLPTVRGAPGDTEKDPEKKLKKIKDAADQASASTETLSAFFDFSSVGADAFMGGGDNFGARDFGASVDAFMPKEVWDGTLDHLGERFAKMQDTSAETFDAMSIYAEQAGRNMQDAFADFLFDPLQDGFDGMLEGFANTLRRLAAEAAASQLFDALGDWGKNNSGSDGWVGAIAQGAASLFGGKRATGGSTLGGMLYEVGEGGRPEVFEQNGRRYLISGNNGNVIPAARMAGAGAAVGGGDVNIKVEVVNKGGGLEVESQETQRMGDGTMLVRLITNTMKGAIASGQLDREMGQSFGVRRAGMPRG